jgi:hypothetical protein
MRGSRVMPQLLAAGILLAVGITWLIVLGLRQEIAWGSDRSGEIITIDYAVSDLAVWEKTAGGEARFEPQILVRLIRKSVAPHTWGESASIQAREDDASLVVQQTASNHKRIERLLRQVRSECGLRAAGTP